MRDEASLAVSSWTGRLACFAEMKHGGSSMAMVQIPYFVNEGTPGGWTLAVQGEINFEINFKPAVNEPKRTDINGFAGPVPSPGDYFNRQAENLAKQTHDLPATIPPWPA